MKLPVGVVEVPAGQLPQVQPVVFQIANVAVLLGGQNALLCGAAVLLVGAFFLLVGGIAGAAFPHIHLASVTAYLSQFYGGTDTIAGGYFFVLNLVVAAAVLCTFPLQLTPAGHIFHQAIPRGCGGSRSLVARRLANVLVVSGCAGLVYALPSLQALVDLIGALTNTTIAAIPCAIHLRVLSSLKDGPL